MPEEERGTQDGALTPPRMGCRRQNGTGLTMTNFYYFAYGSNMLAERLAARCPGAQALGPAKASGYEVHFCLGSDDGSAKAGILEAQGRIATGVLYMIPEHEGAALDAVEGHPDTYTRHETLEVVYDEKTYQALTYLPHKSRLSTPDLLPYDWYRALCLAGALQHQIDNEFIENLVDSSDMATDESNEIAVEGRRLAVSALRSAGFNELVAEVS